MAVVVDSHALLWYLSKNNKLSPKAKKELDNSEKIIVSVIVILKLLYILQKFGEEKKFKGLLAALLTKKYLIYPVDLALVKRSAKLPKDFEMHDRLIVATAKIFNAHLVTKDKQISSAYSKIIW